MDVTEENGDTTLSGVIAGPEALHSLLGKIGALGLPLVSVSRVEPDLEEVFVQLTKAES
jgi:ABC-2 type transport system ATP-binding protein